MELSQITSDGLQRQLSITIPADHVDKKIRERLKKITTKVHMDGFRPGKVPTKVVERRYGNEIYEEVTQNLMQDTAKEALKKSQLDPVDGVSVSFLQTPQKGQDLKFVITFEVLPNVQFNDIAAIKIIKPEIAPDDPSFLDFFMAFTRVRYTSSSPIPEEERAEKNMAISTEIHANHPKENTSFSKKKDFLLKDTEKYPIVTQFIGTKKGDCITATPEVLQPFFEEHLDNIASSFSVKILSVCTVSTPELEDPFFHALTKGAMNKETYTHHTLNSAQNKLQFYIQRYIEKQIVTALVQQYVPHVELPRLMLKEHYDHVVHELQQNNVNTAQITQKDIETEAKNNTLWKILIKAMALHYNLRATTADMDAAVKSAVASLGNHTFNAWLKKYPNELTLMLKQRESECMVMRYLIENEITVTPTPMDLKHFSKECLSFQELVNLFTLDLEEEPIPNHSESS